MTQKIFTLFIAVLTSLILRGFLISSAYPALQYLTEKRLEAIRAEVPAEKKPVASARPKKRTKRSA